MQVFSPPAGPTSYLQWSEKTELRSEEWFASGPLVERAERASVHYIISQHTECVHTAISIFCPEYQRTSVWPGREHHCCLMTVLTKLSHLSLLSVMCNISWVKKGRIRSVQEADNQDIN